MENSKIWIPEKNYFVLLLPLMAHKSNGGIIGQCFDLKFRCFFSHLKHDDDDDDWRIKSVDCVFF
jgi:hypothetical protein